MNDSPSTSDPTALHCEYHPDRETHLRCNRCEKPICASCAIRTPTGYRCKDCVQSQQKVFDTAQPQDYVVAFLLAGVLSFLGSLLVPWLGFFTIFLAPGAGAVIAAIVRRAVNRRRGKRLFQLAAAATVLGSLVPICSSLGGGLLSILAGSGGAFLGAVGFSLLWQGLYTFIVTSTVYYRLSGIQL